MSNSIVRRPDQHRRAGQPAGVTVSDHEVNIKILIDRAGASAGTVKADERTQLFESMTDEAQLVPPTTKIRNDLMGTSRANAASACCRCTQCRSHLVAERGVNRELEALPSAARLPGARGR